MNIMKKIQRKLSDNKNEGAVTIAFLGDSVTQGCFEIYPQEDKIGVVFDSEHAYSNCLRKLLAYLYPAVPVNIINAGISGDAAPHGLERLEKDVLRHEPDLVVVCFGLNDASKGVDGIDNYRQALGGIFKRLTAEGMEVIFMTPNMLNSYVSPFLAEGLCRQVAEQMSEIQRTGVMDLYMDTARDVCKEYGIKVCDCYHKWNVMANNGVDTTALLSNHINHPKREMSWLFAFSLLEVMMEYK